MIFSLPTHLIDTYSSFPGLDDCVLPYVNFFINNGVNGCKLLLLTSDDLEALNVRKIGHQEIILEGVDLLRNLHYDFASETLQSQALKLGCRARSLFNQLKQDDLERDPSQKERVSTQTLSSVSDILHSVKLFISWIDRYPFCQKIETYGPIRRTILKHSIELVSTAQRDHFVDKPNTIIKAAAIALADKCDQIVQEISDPHALTVTPASLEVIAIKKKADEDLGLHIYSSYSGVHIVGGIKGMSPAYYCGRIEEGDEIVLVKDQLVVGWQLKKLVKVMKESPTQVLLTLKKRPRNGPIVAMEIPKPKNLRIRSSHNRSSHRGSRHHTTSVTATSTAVNAVTTTNGVATVNGSSCVTSSVPGPQHYPTATLPRTMATAANSSTTKTSFRRDQRNAATGNDSDEETFKSSYKQTQLVGAVYHEEGKKTRHPPRRRATISGSSPTSTQPPIRIEDLLPAEERVVESRGRGRSVSHAHPNQQIVTDNGNNNHRSQSPAVSTLSSSSVPASSCQAMRPPSLSMSCVASGGGNGVKTITSRAGNNNKKNNSSSSTFVPPRKSLTTSNSTILPSSNHGGSSPATTVSTIISAIISSSSSYPSSQTTTTTSTAPNSQVPYAKVMPLERKTPTTIMTSTLKGGDDDSNDRITFPKQVACFATTMSSSSSCQSGTTTTLSTSMTPLDQVVKQQQPRLILSQQPLKPGNHHNQQQQFYQHPFTGEISGGQPIYDQPHVFPHPGHGFTGANNNNNNPGSNLVNINQHNVGVVLPHHSQVIPTSTIVTRMPPSPDKSSYTTGPTFSSFLSENNNGKQPSLGHLSQQPSRDIPPPLPLRSSTGGGGQTSHPGPKVRPRVSRSTPCKSLENPEYHGWLVQRLEKPGFLVPSVRWSKRWVVLKQSFLYCFKTPDSPKADTLINLPGFVVAQATEVKSKRCAFKVYNLNAAFHFAAETVAEMSKWISKIGFAAISYSAISKSIDESFYSETDDDDSSDDGSSPSSGHRSHRHHHHRSHHHHPRSGSNVSSCSSSSSSTRGGKEHSQNKEDDSSRRTDDKTSKTNSGEKEDVKGSISASSPGEEKSDYSRTMTSFPVTKMTTMRDGAQSSPSSSTSSLEKERQTRNNKNNRTTSTSPIVVTSSQDTPKKTTSTHFRVASCLSNLNSNQSETRPPLRRQNSCTSSMTRVNRSPPSEGGKVDLSVKSPSQGHISSHGRSASCLTSSSLTTMPQSSSSQGVVHIQTSSPNSETSPAKPTLPPKGISPGSRPFVDRNPPVPDSPYVRLMHPPPSPRIRASKAAHSPSSHQYVEIESITPEPSQHPSPPEVRPRLPEKPSSMNQRTPPPKPLPRVSKTPSTSPPEPKNLVKPTIVGAKEKSPEPKGEIANSLDSSDMLLNPAYNHVIPTDHGNRLAIAVDPDVFEMSSPEYAKKNESTNGNSSSNGTAHMSMLDREYNRLFGNKSPQELAKSVPPRVATNEVVADKHGISQVKRSPPNHPPPPLPVDPLGRSHSPSNSAKSDYSSSSSGISSCNQSTYVDSSSVKKNTALLPTIVATDTESSVHTSTTLLSSSNSLADDCVFLPSNQDFDNPTKSSPHEDEEPIKTGQPVRKSSSFRNFLSSPKLLKKFTTPKYHKAKKKSVGDCPTSPTKTDETSASSSSGFLSASPKSRFFSFSLSRKSPSASTNNLSCADISPPVLVKPPLGSSSLFRSHSMNVTTPAGIRTRGGRRRTTQISPVMTLEKSPTALGVKSMTGSVTPDPPRRPMMGVTMMKRRASNVSADRGAIEAALSNHRPTNSASSLNRNSLGNQIDNRSNSPDTEEEWANIVRTLERVGLNVDNIKKRSSSSKETPNNPSPLMKGCDGLVPPNPLVRWDEDSSCSPTNCLGVRILEC